MKLKIALIYLRAMDNCKKLARREYLMPSVSLAGNAVAVQSCIKDIAFAATMLDLPTDAVAKGRHAGSPARRSVWITSVSPSTTPDFLISSPVQTDGGINIRPASNCGGKDG